MPQVWIPSLLRALTGGEEIVSASGETLPQVIEALETRFPGLRARLCEPDGRIRPSLAVVIDGAISPYPLRVPLTADSQVRFMPAISGG